MARVLRGEVLGRELMGGGDLKTGWLTTNEVGFMYTSCRTALDLECYNSFKYECSDSASTIILDCCLILDSLSTFLQLSLSFVSNDVCITLGQVGHVNTLMGFCSAWGSGFKWLIACVGSPKILLLQKGSYVTTFNLTILHFIIGCCSEMKNLAIQWIL